MRDCAAMSGQGGRPPNDFLFLDVCEAFSALPSQVQKESAFWVERMKYKISVKRQSDNDRAVNEKALRDAGL